MRAEVVARVAGMVPDNGRVRVAVDGPGGAGKTVFAGELGAALAALGRPVLRASMDGFHRPRPERYRRGRTSPTGYWLDAFDHGRLAAVLLEPFGRGEPVRTAVHDVRTDARVDLGPIPVPEDAVLIVDGVFTHRDELAAYWEFSVYLQVDMEIAVARMIARDGIPPTTVARYVAADRIYAALRPAERATVVLDNTDVAAPRLRIPAG